MNTVRRRHSVLLLTALFSTILFSTILFSSAWFLMESFLTESFSTECCIATASAEPLPSAQIEIAYLQHYIASSGCQFYRNGIWHDAIAAEAHLHEKYDYLKTGSRIQTSEDFIDAVATASSFTGRAYIVRCDGSADVPSAQWLREELARQRELK